MSVTVHLSPTMEAKLADPTFPHSREEVVAHMERLYVDLTSNTVNMRASERTERTQKLIGGDNAALVDWDACFSSDKFSLLYYASRKNDIKASQFGVFVTNTHNVNATIPDDRPIIYDIVRMFRLSNRVRGLVVELLTRKDLDIEARSPADNNQTVTELLVEFLEISQEKNTIVNLKKLIPLFFKQGCVIPEEAYNIEGLQSSIRELQARWNKWQLIGSRPESLNVDDLLAFRALGKLGECFADERWEGKDTLALKKMEFLRPSFQGDIAREKLALQLRLVSKTHAPSLEKWTARVSAPAVHAEMVRV